jgi:chemotaxis protein CheC
MKDPIMREKQKDALQEAGNIAAGYAASALSKLIDEKIMLEITTCKTVKVTELPHVLNNKIQFVVGINMLVPTQNLCTVLMFIPYKAALKFIDMFSKNKVGTTKEISYREYVVLTEIGTICLCGYLNALSKLLDEQIIPTPPAVACDVVDSILEDVIPSVDSDNENAVLLETKFIHKDDENNGYILFIPDKEFKDSIFKAFKVKNT